jgi:hypothetical protein
LGIGPKWNFVQFEILYYLLNFGNFWNHGTTLFTFVNLEAILIFGKSKEIKEKVYGASPPRLEPAHMSKFPHRGASASAPAQY